MMENNTVGEQINVEQLIENRKVMTISKAMIMNIGMITHKYRGSQQFSRVEYSTQIY